MKYSWLIVISLFISCQFVLSQEKVNSERRILFRGIVRDASSFQPLPNAQIIINNTFSSLSGNDGTFDFFVYRNDSIVFTNLGYKPAVINVNDTLYGKEFIVGVYMQSDTLSAGEVIIVPRLLNLKSEILNADSKAPPDFENARYNMAVSAYQGRTSQGTLGDPADNYAVLAQKQKTEAFERGGIPSDKIAGISPLMLIPGAILLIKGPPEKPGSMEMKLTRREINQVHMEYLRSRNVK